MEDEIVRKTIEITKAVEKAAKKRAYDNDTSVKYELEQVIMNELAPRKKKNEVKE